MGGNTITTTIRASGPCPKCGATNLADIPVTGMPGASAVVTATVSCGNQGCDATLGVSGQGVLQNGGR